MRVSMTRRAPPLRAAPRRPRTPRTPRSSSTLALSSPLDACGDGDGALGRALADAARRAASHGEAALIIIDGNADELFAELVSPSDGASEAARAASRLLRAMDQAADLRRAARVCFLMLARDPPRGGGGHGVATLASAPDPSEAVSGGNALVRPHRFETVLALAVPTESQASIPIHALLLPAVAFAHALANGRQRAA